MQNKIKLLCLPFAGGSSYAYFRFNKFLPEWIELMPMDYPGHGTRIEEPLCTNMADIVIDMYRKVKPFTEQPYAIFGHSMGATVALLLARKIHEENLTPPMHLFVTGHGGPSLRKDRVLRYTMSRKDLIEEIKGYQGMPDDVLENETFLDFCLPIIRADFKAYETYEYESHNKLLVPITCVTGKDEDISTEQIKAWEIETNGKLEVRQIPGKHFFIYDHGEELMQIFQNQLHLVHDQINFNMGSLKNFC